jgi:hypothetical protein
LFARFAKAVTTDTSSIRARTGTQLKALRFVPVAGNIRIHTKGESLMRKAIQTIVIVILLLVAFVSLKTYAATPKKPEPQVWTPGCVASVPKSWGVYRGASAQSGLAFEDSAGTIRFLTNIPCDGAPVVALEIRRTAGNPSN